MLSITLRKPSRSNPTSIMSEMEFLGFAFSSMARTTLSRRHLAGLRIA
jgi:hypothetical protein